jgi:hypothetical protein
VICARPNIRIGGFIAPEAGRPAWSFAAFTTGAEKLKGRMSPVRAPRGQSVKCAPPALSFTLGGFPGSPSLLSADDKGGGGSCRVAAAPSGGGAGFIQAPARADGPRPVDAGTGAAGA